MNAISEEKTGGELYYLLFKTQLKATGSKIIKKNFTLLNQQFQLTEVLIVAKFFTF